MNAQYKNYHALILLTMIYLSITLAAGVMVNKLVILGPGYVQGGAIITPLWYSLADIMTEVYGYKILRQILWSALISQLIFSSAIFLMIHLPSPPFWHDQGSYYFVFGNILRIYFSGSIAFLISGFINIYVISKWKILILGKHFWLRNIGASTVAEAIYTALIIPMISIGNLEVKKMLLIIAISYGFKVIYAIVMAIPASIVVKYLKKLEDIDVYDYGVNFSPFVLKVSESITARPEITHNEIIENPNTYNRAIINIEKYKSKPGDDPV